MASIFCVLWHSKKWRPVNFFDLWIPPPILKRKVLTPLLPWKIGMWKMLFVYGTKTSKNDVFWLFFINRLQNKHPISHPYSENPMLDFDYTVGLFLPPFPTILCTMGLTIIEYYNKIIFCAAPPSPLSVSDRWVVGGDGSWRGRDHWEVDSS